MYRLLKIQTACTTPEQEYFNKIQKYAHNITFYKKLHSSQIKKNKIFQHKKFTELIMLE